MGAELPPVEVKVWGEFACFTRPEMKVERVSYPVMTPTAARGVLEAIFWKPQFVWQIQEIHVLNEIRYASFIRNELSSKQSAQAAIGWASTGRGSYLAYGDRTQRHTLALREVAYVIRADVRLKPGITDNVAKYRDQFRRRVARGQCFSMPYLGCREFSAAFAEPTPVDRPVPITDSLGSMLLDVEHRPGQAGRPLFFDAHLVNGVLQVPERED